MPSFCTVDCKAYEFPHKCARRGAVRCRVRVMQAQCETQLNIDITLISRIGAVALHRLTHHQAVLLRHLLQRTLFLHATAACSAECAAIQAQLEAFRRSAWTQARDRVDRDKVVSFLQQVELPAGTTLEAFAEKARCLGLGDPFSELYWREREFPQVPYVLLLACVEAAQWSSWGWDSDVSSRFVVVSRTLYGLSGGKSHVDGVALAVGVATILNQMDISYARVVGDDDLGEE